MNSQRANPRGLTVVCYDLSFVPRKTGKKRLTHILKKKKKMKRQIQTQFSHDGDNDNNESEANVIPCQEATKQQSRAFELLPPELIECIIRMVHPVKIGQTLRATGALFSTRCISKLFRKVIDDRILATLETLSRLVNFTTSRRTLPFFSGLRRYKLSGRLLPLVPNDTCLQSLTRLESLEIFSGDHHACEVYTSLTSLTELTLDTVSPEEDLRHLNSALLLPKLQSLDLRVSGIVRDQHLEPFATRLTKLTLHQCPSIKGATLALGVAFARLASLRLINNTVIADAVVASLAPTLRELVISQTSLLTGECFAALTNLERLELLDITIDGCHRPVRKEQNRLGATYVAPLATRLRCLVFSDRNLMFNGTFASNLTALESLTVSDARLFEGSSLRNMTNLTELNIGVSTPAILGSDLAHLHRLKKVTHTVESKARDTWEFLSPGAPLESLSLECSETHDLDLYSLLVRYPLLKYLQYEFDVPGIKRLCEAELYELDRMCRERPLTLIIKQIERKNISEIRQFYKIDNDQDLDEFLAKQRVVYDEIDIPKNFFERLMPHNRERTNHF